MIINSEHKLKIGDFSLSSICSKEKNFKYDLWFTGNILNEMLFLYHLFGSNKEDKSLINTIEYCEFDYQLKQYINKDAKELVKKY